jgi:hypothetical protein
MNKNFARPVRNRYTHRVCGSTTEIARIVAEAHARSPRSMVTAFCRNCAYHFPSSEFVWYKTLEKLGE